MKNKLAHASVLFGDWEKYAIDIDHRYATYMKFLPDFDNILFTTDEIRSELKKKMDLKIWNKIIFHPYVFKNEMLHKHCVPIFFKDKQYSHVFISDMELFIDDIWSQRLYNWLKSGADIYRHSNNNLRFNYLLGCHFGYKLNLDVDRDYTKRWFTNKSYGNDEYWMNEQYILNVLNNKFELYSDVSIGTYSYPFISQNINWCDNNNFNLPAACIQSSYCHVYRSHDNRNNQLLSTLFLKESNKLINLFRFDDVGTYYNINFYENGLFFLDYNMWGGYTYENDILFTYTKDEKKMWLKHKNNLFDGNRFIIDFKSIPEIPHSRLTYIKV